MNPTRVLCVENQPEYKAALKYMLEAVGYQVTVADSGAEALQMLAAEPVDGVLLEYDLPDATGTTIRAEMKRIKPELPVLLFAGVGEHTPFLLRFFDVYLHDAQLGDSVSVELEQPR